MAYTKNATVDSWDTNKQLEYYKANPNEAKQEIARAQGVGGSAAANWASQLQGLSSDPRAASGSASTVPTTITSRPTASNGGGSSILRDAYDSRGTTNGGNPWNGYNPIGAAGAPSAYVSSAGKNTSGVGVSTPATSYTGASSVIGNVNGSTDLNKSYQGLYDSVRANDPTRNQINTWGDKNGNVYDTTKMTAQQIFALSLNKDNNPNAAAILKGMGLDMNGNPTSPMPTFSFGGSGGGGGLSSDPRVSLSSVYADSKATQSGSTSTGYTKNPTVDALPLQQQLDYYRQHPEEAQQEILRSMQVYNGASTDAQRNGAHTWADQLRQAAGISDSDLNYGNNNGLDPATQRKYLDALLSGRSNVNTGTGTGTDGTGGTGGTGAGTGLGTDPRQSQSNKDYIQSSFEKNLAAILQLNKSSLDLSLADLAGQEDVIGQSAISGLNNNDVMANQRMQALKESMANDGLSASGDNISAQIGIGTSQQQGANDINTNKGNLLRQLMAKRGAITSNAAANDLAATQQLQAQKDMMMLNQGNADRTFDYTASQDAIKNSQWDKQFGAQEAQRSWDNTFKNQQWDYQKASDLWERTFKEKTFDQSVKQFAANLGADYDKMTQSQQQFIAEQTYKNKALNWSMSDSNPDNIYKNQQITNMKAELDQIGKTKPITTQDAINVLNKSPFYSEATTLDAFGNPVKTGKKSVDKTGMVQAIAGIGVPDAQMDALFTYYGISQDEVKAIEEQLRKK